MAVLAELGFHWEHSSASFVWSRLGYTLTELGSCVGVGCREWELDVILMFQDAVILSGLRSGRS